MFTRFPAVVIALVCGGAALSIAHADSAGPAPAKTTTSALTGGGSETSEVTDAVTVQAHREKMSRLRQDINKSVDDFFDAFNKANTVPGYETSCSDEKSYGSYIVRHICTPRFVQAASEDETQGFFYGYAAIPASNLVALRMPDYKKRLHELIYSDPKARQAAVDFETLTERYLAVSKEKVQAR